MNKPLNRLDEMQREKRDNIGNQMFLVMFGVLMLNGGLEAAGVAWLPYPSNITFLITVCMDVYIVRRIAANAHQPNQPQTRRIQYIVHHLLLIRGQI